MFGLMDQLDSHLKQHGYHKGVIMKKIMILILICLGISFIASQYPGTPNIKPPIPADIDNALLTWAIINAATKEQRDCHLYIDRYQISTTNSNENVIFETILDTYTGEVISRKKLDGTHYTTY